MLRFTSPRTHDLSGRRQPAAARAAGLPVEGIGTSVFALAGACAALAGIFMASFQPFRLAAAEPWHAEL